MCVAPMDPAPVVPTKEMKLIIPARLANALHAHKVITGQKIHVTIEQALREYFGPDAPIPGI